MRGKEILRGLFSYRLIAAALLLWGFLPPPAAAGEEESAVVSHKETALRKTFGFNAGAGFGSRIFGGQIKHDFSFLNLEYGRIVGSPSGEDRWWEGRWLIMAEATLGRELHPGDSWVVSLAPVVRYLFGYPATVVPFVELGLGLTWTDIREPDLGGDFQFNSQGGAGVYLFDRPQLAYTLQYRFVHYSNAGIRRPNGGVNIHAVLIGVSYFF